MRIALLTSPSTDESGPLTFSLALSPAQRIERHLKKQGHRVKQFAFQVSKENLFEIEEFIKVEDVEFTIAFGGFWALSVMSQQQGEWALFLSYIDVLNYDDGFDATSVIRALYRAKAIITDDLRAYNFLIKRLWLLQRRIYYIGKAVLPLSQKLKSSLSDFLLPANARWFLLNRDQKEVSDSLLDLFSEWHQSDPQIHLLAPLSDYKTSTNWQIAKIVNRSGVVEIKEPSFEAYCFAVQNCLAIIDPSSHPEESLLTMLGLEMGRPTLILQKNKIAEEKRGELENEKNVFTPYTNDQDLLSQCRSIDLNQMTNAIRSNSIEAEFKDAQRENEEYKELIAQLFAN